MIDFKTFVKEQEEHEEFLQEVKSQGIYVGTFGDRFVAFKLISSMIYRKKEEISKEVLM